MKYDLVLEGSGAKGLAFFGATQEFEARGHTHDRLLGTSAGAIIATLLAAGYTSDEMSEAVAEKKGEKSIFSDFMGEPGSFKDSPLVKDGTLARLLSSIDVPMIPDALEKRLDDSLVKWLASNPKASHLFSLVELGGWYSADNFLKWIGRKLDSGEYYGKPRNFSKMNLKDFYEVTGKDLSLVASDITAEMMLVLNHKTTPKLPIVWAVLMSMNIPLLWQDVAWKTEWGKYRGLEIESHLIVDGCLLSNFPIELFISDSKSVTDVMGDKTNQNVLGILIDESLPVPGAQTSKDKDRKEKIDMSQLPAVQKFNYLVNTVLSAREKSVIDAFEKLVARIPAKGYGTAEFDMTDERRSNLVQAGQKAMQDYFDKEQQSGTLDFTIDIESVPASINLVNELTEKKERPEVFLSYSRTDSETMKRVRDALRTEGIMVWTDEGIEPGTPNWMREIERAIQRAKGFMVLLSPDAYDSEWVRNEISLARQNYCRLLPLIVRGEPRDVKPLDLTNVQHVDIREEEQVRPGLTKLISICKKEGWAS